MVLIWLIKVVFYKNVFFSLYIKIGESTHLTCYQKKQRFDTKDSYKNYKARLRKQARDKYKSLS